MKELRKFVVVAITGLVLAGAAVGIVAAQTGGDATPTPAVDEKESLREEFLSRLAQELGISQEQLEEALKQTGLDMVDQALADGRITEEKATEIRERIEAGEFPFFGFGHGMRHGHGIRHGFGPGACGVDPGALADFLGVSVDELRAARADGQSLAQIAEEQGKSRDELKSFLAAQLQERLDQAVADGKITQEQADEILANAPERIDELIDREGLPWGPHMRPPEGITPEMMPGGGFMEPAPEGAGPLF